MAAPKLSSRLCAVDFGSWCAETAAPKLPSELCALAFGGRLVMLPLALGLVVGKRTGGGLALLSGNFFGVSVVGGGALGGRTAGHSTGLGHAVSGTSATVPLGFGPFALGTGASAADPLGLGPFAIGTGVSIAGGRCAEAATPELAALLSAVAFGSWCAETATPKLTTLLFAFGAGSSSLSMHMLPREGSSSP